MQSTPARMHARMPGVAVRVRRDLEAGAVRFVDDRRELLVGVLLRARERRCATSRRPTRRS